MESSETGLLSKVKGRSYSEKAVFSHFVGRQREIARLQKGLLRGETIIVSGKFGIGRSRLVRHIADLNKEQWRFVFVDCSRRAAEICQKLFSELHPGRRSKAGDFPYKWLRFTISKFQDTDRETVIVLDNIGKVSAAKLDLLRYWKLNGAFQYIAITEPFLSKEQFSQLVGCIGPAETVTLGPLPLARVQEFFENGSRIFDLQLQPADIRGLSTATRGYPLAMTELLTAEIQRYRSGARY